MNDMVLGQEMIEEGVDPALEEEQRARLAEANSRLLAVIDEQHSQALGGEQDPMSVDRAQAIDYYLGEPFGNEIEGRSRVVSKDVFDTVEWMKPALMRIFAGGDTVVEFAPQGEEDINGAEQEADYVNYVVQRRNPWFMTALEWFSDALLTRNAYCLAYWQDSLDPSIERYQGLTDDQMTLLMLDREVVITGHRGYLGPPMLAADQQLALMQMGMISPESLPPTPLHDVEVRRTSSYGCAKLCVLPPERCLVAHDTPGMSVRSSNYFEFWEYKTISELRRMGFEVADDISDSSGATDTGLVDQARDALTEQSPESMSLISADPSMKKVKARMIWVRCDHDGDGLAEMRYVVRVGREILANQEVSCVTVAAIVPTPMPHRHVGLSLWDHVQDLQLIRSVMLRGVIDNQFLANNGRYGVDKNRVNLDDMLISRPGGAVRVNGSPHEAIMPFQHPQTATAGIAVLEYLDGIRESRGGVSKVTAGADMSSIMAQPGTVAQLASAASQKIELIARILGEGVKELFSIVHELTLTNATAQDKVQLRGKWVTIDPRQWKKRQDMSLAVGMGIVSRPQQAGALVQLISLQEKALPLGLTSLPKMHTAYSKYAEALGFANGAMFFDAPPEGATYQPAPDPMVVATQIQAQARVTTEQMRNQAAAVITMMKEEAASQRTFFEEMMENQREAQDRFVRVVSEATDRMQELRLENAKTPAKTENTVQIAGLSELGDAVKQVAGMTEKVGEHARAAGEAVKEIKEIGARKRKRTIKTDKGKTYTVEEE